MKTVFGLILVVLGIVLGTYVGLYKCFIGGIVDIVDAVQVTPIMGMAIAWGIVKMMLAGFFGWLTGILPVVFGLALLKDN